MQGAGSGTNVFAWTYKDLKGISPKLAQQKIELDITIPPTHHAMYRLNPNYVIAIKQYMDKLLVIWIHSICRRGYMVVARSNST
jgi:hypothetical protein